MKNLVLVVMIATSISLQAQIPALKLTSDGMAPVVVNIEGKTASEIYQKAMNWIQVNYKHPDQVVQATVQNENVRIRGFASNVWTTKTLGIPGTGSLDYMLELEIKDGKYKFNISRITLCGVSPTPLLYTYKSSWKNNGDVKKSHLPAIAEIEEGLNNINLSLYNYITGKDDKNSW